MNIFYKNDYNLLIDTAVKYGNYNKIKEILKSSIIKLDGN